MKKHLNIQKYSFYLNKSILVIVALAATIAPFWCTNIIPSTDLPQHLGQVFLLKETLAGFRPELSVTPFYFPNTLIYGLIYVLWQTDDPLLTSKLAMSALAAIWLLASLTLTKFQERPFENWLISTPLVFNFLFYWGLLNFLIGWPIFCLLIIVTNAVPSRKTFIKTALIILLLYYAHALWFLFANLWLITKLINQQDKNIICTIGTTLPTWIFAAIWYPELASSRQHSGVETGLIWGKMPFDRLDKTYFSDSAFGGLYGNWEPALITILLVWIVVAIATQWGEIEEKTDKSIFLAGVLMLLGFFILPSTYMNTIFFNQRWVPCGMVLLLLALPSPRLPKIYLTLLGIGCLTISSAATIKDWKNWEEESLGGFLEAISLIKENDNIIALNFHSASAFIKGRPGLQLFAYAQTIRKANLFFNFTEHYSGPVLYRDLQHPNTDRKILWSPILTRNGFQKNYDKTFIHGGEILHSYSVEKLGYIQVGSATTPWRLYTKNNP